MKLFKEVIKNNLKMIIFYILIGITINFLDLYSVTYYQKILDAFQFKTLTLLPLIIYGVLLVVSTILGYIENYPEQQVKNKLYLDFKLQSLKNRLFRISKNRNRKINSKSRRWRNSFKRHISRFLVKNI